MKTCKACGVIKAEGEFPKHRTYCLDCRRAKDRERYQANAESIRVKKLEYWRRCMATDPDAVRERQKKYFAANPGRWSSPEKSRERFLSMSDEARRARIEKLNAWAAEHPYAKSAREAKRRASKLSATPVWANESRIAELYSEAKRLTDQTGVRHQVDHIVPLRSKRVCGLHVEANLRVITAVENGKKLNRYWPDMP